MKKDYFIALGLFLFSFAFFVFHAGPTIVPYRDVGEMSLLLKTFGVAHPPGYPLYTVMGHLFSYVPLGNPAYRANVFSGLAGAMSLSLLFLLLRKWVSAIPAVFACLFLAFSHPFWELSIVAEMYALGVALILLILLGIFRWNQPLLSCFLCGLALGARMDLLLFVPVVAVWVWLSCPGFSWRSGLLIFVLGTSVFLFLPIRSMTDPILDWGNPESVGALLASVTRKSYSGTLDLLSLSYQKGENFFISLQIYARHLVRSFGWGGVIFMLLGIWFALKSNKRTVLFLLSIFIVGGPLFLFMANMPPNPHAIAIVEAAYLPPDLVLVIFIGMGLAFLWSFPRVRAGVAGLILLLLAVNLSNGWALNSKRANFSAHDYAVSVLRSVPPEAVAVVHKDVQIFSLWYAQGVERKRPDAAIVASGLSGSPWYWEMKTRWGTAPAPEVSLKNPDGWLKMSQHLKDRLLLAGYDVQLPLDPNLPISGHGALASLKPMSSEAIDASGRLLLYFTLDRARLRYGETPDFFSSDLVGDRARAFYQQGLAYLSNGRSEEAARFFHHADYLDPTFPPSSSSLGYLYFTQGDYPAAERAYKEAVRRGLELNKKAKAYNALPEVVQSARWELSNSYVSWGGALEKLGHVDLARDRYKKALRQASNAQAHYNLGVTYWNRDWKKVVEHLDEALRVDPQMEQARRYREVAVSKMGGLP